MGDFMMTKNRLAQTIGVLAIFAGSTQAASAIGLLSGYGGTRDYGDLAMNRNDDGSSNVLNLPFTLNFFGNNYNTFYINNNGNITFTGPVGSYTPTPFPISSRPMIAPYWGDVDTRGTSGIVPNSNNVWVASPNAQTTVVTWDSVGYYGSHTDKLNDFQLVLRDRSDTGAGNFDIDFRYNQLQWTTGDASGGSQGLGGTPAQAGYDAGDLTHFFTLPGSRTAAVLDLANTSNVSLSTPGLWTFPIRNGAISDGSTPSTPLVPDVVQQDGWHFDFNIVLGQQIFIDPLVATGYDFIVDSGPNILSALLPSVGDSIFDICLWNGSAWGSCSTANAGVPFVFGGAGVDRFRVLGIETSAGLDPTNTTAFVTGLTFAGAGTVSMRQVPITTDVSNGAVPEIDATAGTGALTLLGGVLAMVSERRRRRQAV